MSLQADFYLELDAFHLEVRLEADSRRLALLGASGSGKSAVLRCIAGTLTPDEGHILLDGQPLFDSARRINLPPQRRQMGFLFRRGALFPHMTVEQNIAAAVPNRAEREKTVGEYLRKFRLEEAAKKRPRDLDPMERQRTALARLMASEPSAILLDEPLSAPDSFLKFRLEQELADALEHFGGPVIWASHDRGEVYRNCRYACVLDAGVSQEVVSVEGLLAHPGTESAARLSGCKNFVDAIARGSAVYLPKWGVTLRCAYPLPPFLWRIGVRAHQIRLSEPDRVNAFAVTAVRVVEDVDRMIVLCRPDGAAQDAPLLRMELEKDEWIAAPNKRRFTVSIGPQDILLLR